MDADFESQCLNVYVSECVCVCVFVCEREREREIERIGDALLWPCWAVKLWLYIFTSSRPWQCELTIGKKAKRLNKRSLLWYNRMAWLAHMGHLKSMLQNICIGKCAHWLSNYKMLPLVIRYCDKLNLISILDHANLQYCPDVTKKVVKKEVKK